ncbi:MAG: PTS glucose/sucrose transporter subunit IIB [Chlamydiia bacterium]|nr:PTS glucose/sucrose transporter subunit IIB [Chlamydiia bacterium]
MDGTDSTTAKVAKGSNKYTADATAILKAVGGKSNVKELGNCATRLRFVLKDNTKVNAADIKKTKAMGQMKVTGGYQVIMGPTVEMFADEIHSLMNK